MARFAFVTLPSWILGVLMLAGIAIGFANVVSRYVFGHALFWAEEVMVFLTIWGVFVGMAAIAYNGDHLRMDLFSARIGGRWRVTLGGLMTLVLLASCAFALTQSFRVVALFVQTGSVSVSAGVPKAIPHAALAAGFALTILAVVVRIRSYFTGKF
jgi:TRAP-type C4-dicarboxylate transport system permease small subunit